MRRSDKQHSGTTACSAALILLSLTGCAAPVNSAAIPRALTEPCAQPELTGETYADVIRLAFRQRQALAECNERLETIRRLGAKK